jgi:hypothetical protein
MQLPCPSRGAQHVLSLMGQVRNIFTVGKYKNTDSEQRDQFNNAKDIWDQAASLISWFCRSYKR